MKVIRAEEITKRLKSVILKSCVEIEPSCEDALRAALARESSPQAKFALEMLCKNIEAAKSYGLPACQDTGMAVIFADIGQDVRIEGGYIEDAINEAVRQAYGEGFFRMSVLDPISRQNTGDNTPAMVHYRMTEGEELKISFLAKGFGSENMSRLYMLKPSDGEEGIKGAAVETVKLAGGKPCPPVIVGIGVGGTADKAMELSKRALLRKIGSKNPDPGLYALEEEILQRINALKIGAQGFGGDTTALAVFIEKFPTHIAALPVGVNIQCHSVRKGEVAL